MEKECSELDGRRQEEGGEGSGATRTETAKVLARSLSYVARPSPCILSPCSSRETERVKQITSSETYLSQRAHSAAILSIVQYYYVLYLGVI